MAILKIISHGKNNRAKRQLLQYILNKEKTEENLCCVCGDYQKEHITPQDVYQEFQRIRKLFGKDKKKDSRTYTHGTISFAKGEISPEEVKEFVQEFVEKVYPNHQAVIASHTDTEHRHAHFVIEPVSFLDGTMLHTSKKDLEQAKEICNEMCRERALSVPEKGHHYDGSQFDEGEVTTWNRNKYYMMIKSPKKAYMADLAYAVEVCKKLARSKEEFCRLLGNEYG